MWALRQTRLGLTLHSPIAGTLAAALYSLQTLIVSSVSTGHDLDRLVKDPGRL